MKHKARRVVVLASHLNKLLLFINIVKFWGVGGLIWLTIAAYTLSWLFSAVTVNIFKIFDATQSDDKITNQMTVNKLN